MLDALLQKIGLDQDEVSLYLTLIEMKEGTAGKLAMKSSLPRTYTYVVLKRLMEKGFVAQSDSPRAIRKYSITDFEAPRRYFEKQQLSLYQTSQMVQDLKSKLEHLANPGTPAVFVQNLADFSGLEDFWKLLHSTITREIWVINPPSFWGDISHSLEIKKWEQFRLKQHIWEKRLYSEHFSEKPSSFFTEAVQLKGVISGSVSLFLVDQYQIQIPSWNPFRALRIASQEFVDLFKAAL